MAAGGTPGNIAAATAATGSACASAGEIATGSELGHRIAVNDRSGYAMPESKALAIAPSWAAVGNAAVAAHKACIANS